MKLCTYERPKTQNLRALGIVYTLLARRLTFQNCVPGSAPQVRRIDAHTQSRFDMMERRMEALDRKLDGTASPRHPGWLIFHSYK